MQGIRSIVAEDPMLVELSQPERDKLVRTRVASAMEDLENRLACGFVQNVGDLCGQAVAAVHDTLGWYTDEEDE